MVRVTGTEKERERERKKKDGGVALDEEEDGSRWLKSFSLRHIPVPASCLGVPGGQSHHTRSQGVSETHKHTHTQMYTVAQRTCPVLCPQYQMAVVSRGRATVLDPGQVISFQNISQQRGHSAASESLAASVITKSPFCFIILI